MTRWPILMLALAGGGAGDAPPRFGLPVACRIGSDCFVQNYVDTDPSPAVKDFKCGGRSYDGHDGTDIRIASVARQRQGVAVLAGAAGTVLRRRDGVADHLLGAGEADTVAGVECGNGVVIDHGGGWTSQYCHMAQGSTVVAPGQKVAAGTQIGRVGLSGKTQFPHLDISIRHDGKIVDPFAPDAAPGQCGSAGGGGASLWSTASGLQDSYRRGAVLAAGFATGPVSLAAAVENGADQQPRPERDAPAVVAFVLAIGLEAGDVQRLVLLAPDGSELARNDASPLDRDKAQVVLFSGRRRPAQGWPPGALTAHYAVERGGQVVIARDFELRF